MSVEISWLWAGFHAIQVPYIVSQLQITRQNYNTAINGVCRAFHECKMLERQGSLTWTSMHCSQKTCCVLCLCAAHFFYDGKKKVLFSPVLALMMMVSLLLSPPTRNIDRWKQHAHNPSVGTVELIPGNMRSPTEVEEGAGEGKSVYHKYKISSRGDSWKASNITHWQTIRMSAENCS